jgi:hypothetical protein
VLHNFLSNNRDELIRRCKEKVSLRPRRAATPGQLRNGVPMFLDQLTKTLQADEAGESGASERISGASGGVPPVLSEMSVTAAAHGKQLLELGYTVDQVVHDYGDLCQAVTDLAFERDAPFAVDEFRTLNRCLDNAIADAVSEFSFQRDEAIQEQRAAEANERIETGHTSCVDPGHSIQRPTCSRPGGCSACISPGTSSSNSDAR